MFKKLTTTMRLAAILGLVLTLALSTTWAKKPRKNKGESTQSESSTTTDSPATTTNSPSIEYYSNQMIVKKGKGNWMSLVKQGQDEVYVDVIKGSLDAYMAEQGITSVEITGDLIAEQVQRADGSSYYRVTVIFGPSGAYFHPPLELSLKGKYVADDTDIVLLDESGEALETHHYNESGMIYFEVPHFSSYSYDFYDEY